MKSMADWLADLRFEVHAFSVELRTLAPPSYRALAHCPVSIAWTPERLELQIVAAVGQAQRALPGATLRVTLHLWGGLCHYMLVQPAEAESP